MTRTADDIMRQYSEPFARALAVFVNECHKAEAGLTSEPLLVHAAEVGEDEQRQLESEFSRVDELAAAGALDVVELNEASLQELITQRIRHAISSKGWTQAQLASEIGVSPTVVSRVLKRPDRSRVDTIHRIARALEIDLGNLLAR